jgi:ferredoxin--NADP+ reductase
VSKIPPDVARIPRFHLRFLSSPAQILGEGGRVSGLVLEKNELVLGNDGESRARGSGTFETIDVDTVIFAIGDVVDASLGLPVQYGEYVKNPQPRFPVEGISYEAFDLRTNQVIADTFLAGWARRPSAGLVGVARKDATNAALAIAQHLQTLTPTCAPVLARLEERLREIGHPVVGKQELARLDTLEEGRARAENRPFFKFSTNEAMLEALGLQPSADG